MYTLEDELRDKYNKTQWGQLLIRAGFDPYDTEMSARMVARHAVDELNALEKENTSLESGISYLERMGPEWAQGFTSESVAALVLLTDKLELWELLGANNQTMAVNRLKRLLEK